MKAAGVLVEVLDPPTGSDDTGWTAWYDEVYLPRFARLPGVQAARRLTGVVGSVPAMTVYDLDDFLLPRSSEWRQVHDEVNAERPPDGAAQVLTSATRTLYRQIFSTVEPYEVPTTAVLHGAFFEAEPEHHSEFNDWYNTEHVRFIDVVDGYRNCRRFQALDDATKFLALYDVDSLEVAESEHTARATDSPWSDRVRAKLVTYRERRIFRVERLERGDAT